MVQVVENISQTFREFLLGAHRQKKLNYIVAVSSGLPVAEGIPRLIGKRAPWAAREGANFIEVAVESPAELIMEEQDLISAAAQLNLSYNLHTSVSLAFAKSYRHMGGGGFDPAHDYLMSIIDAAGVFKRKLEEQTKNTPFGKQTLIALNVHMSNSTIPPLDERLASDVSVDPYGNDMRNISKESKIYGNKSFREQFWEGFFKPLLKDNWLRMMKAFSDNDKDFADKVYKLRLKEIEKLVRKKYREYPEVMKALEQEAYGAIIKFLQEMDPHAYERTLIDALNNPGLEKEARKTFIKSPDAFRYLQWAVSRAFTDDELMKESFIFRVLMPRWMPHAEQAVRNIWTEITGITTTNPGSFEKQLKELMANPRGEERVIAAVAGAYVWGHFTQEIGGYRELKHFKDTPTVAELLKKYKLLVAFEAHYAPTIAENLRIWKPADMIAVVKSINKTARGEVTGITIDMEQIATLKVDPLWVIEGDKSRGYRGIRNGDGKYIKIMHVTHPELGMGGAGHHHGPIRRGDVLNFRYIYALIKKGFCQQDKPGVVLYELGSEKAESVYMLRLIMDMVEYGIVPEDLKVENIENVLEGEPKSIKERLLQEFFGLSKAELIHDRQTVLEHALDPLTGLMSTTKAEHTWGGKAATEKGTSPDEYKREEYR